MGNPNHDALGRFAHGPGSGSLVSNIATSLAHKRAQLSQDPALQVGMKPDGSMDYAERAKFVDKKLTALYDDGHGQSTETLYKVDGKWTPERRKQQEALINEIWVNQALMVPNDGEALFTGGLGGSGKGWALSDKGFNVDERQYFTVNPDKVKELMAERGMLDDVVKRLAPELTPMEASPLAHEEASTIARRLAEKAYRQRKNVIWDITMSSVNSVKVDRIDVMREKGYTDIRGLFVDVTIAKSVEQANNRWIGGMEKYIGGEGFGGRFLPSGATKSNTPKDPAHFNSKNREVFETIKGSFDGYAVVDNMLVDKAFKDRIVETVGGGIKR